MDHEAQRDETKREAVARGGFSLVAAHERHARLHTLGGEDVRERAVLVLQEREVCATVRIVCNRLDRRGHVVLLTHEVDDTVATLSTAAFMTGGDHAGIVAAGRLADGARKRLHRLLLGDLLERRGHAEAHTLRTSVEFLECHCR